MTTQAVTKPEPVRVLDSRTGEKIELDVKEAATEQLAAFVEVVREQEIYLGAAVGAVEVELLARLDKAGAWTKRVGDPESGVQYEITAPSPTAGTEDYEIGTLRAGLLELLEEGVIDEDAASAALSREIVIVAKVPTGTDLEALVERLSFVTEIAGVPVRDAKVSPSEKVVKAGVQRLAKIGGAAGALVERAKVTLPARSRRPKVTAKRKG